MSDEKPYEITITVADKDGAVTRHLEAPLRHETPNDVVVDLANVVTSRSNDKARVIDADR